MLGCFFLRSHTNGLGCRWTLSCKIIAYIQSGARVPKYTGISKVCTVLRRLFRVFVLIPTMNMFYFVIVLERKKMGTCLVFVETTVRIPGSIRFGRPTLEIFGYWGKEEKRKIVERCSPTRNYSLHQTCLTFIGIFFDIYHFSLSLSLCVASFCPFRNTSGANIK